MDTKAVILLLRTQPSEYDSLCRRHGSESAAKAKFLKRLNAELNQRGMIDVLRHGV